MTVLQGPRRTTLRATLLRGYRVLIVVAVATALRSVRSPDVIPLDAPPLPLDVVQTLLPTAGELTARRDGSFTVLSDDGSPLGRLLRTAPRSDSVIGFSGPTDVALLFDARDVIVHAAIIRSGDTHDHVLAVQDDAAFWKGIRGRSWKDAAAGIDVDAVSGATLTSLALIEGIARRLGGTAPSLRFPDPIRVEELTPVFPSAHSLDDEGPLRAVIDVGGSILGYVFRTSPDGDGVVGYQGPTDTLVALDSSYRVIALRARSSFETPEYIGYIENDPSWDAPLRGTPLDALPDLDLDAAEVEGVSGATMTSVAMAGSVTVRARVIREARSAESSNPAVGFRWQFRDALTAGIVLAALWLGFSRKHRPRWRLALQLGVIVGLGILNGDLVSQAVLVGWARGAVPWRSAAGLTLLVTVALVVPLLTGRQLYCRDLCPHGALQKLARRRFRGRVRATGPAARRLAALPSLLLLAIVAVGVWLTGARETRQLGGATVGGLTLVWLGSVLVHLPQGQALVSLSWAAVGGTVLVTGAVRKIPALGNAGLVVLAVTVAKLLLVDLAEVDALWRAGLFLFVGLGFLRLGFLLPRWTGGADDSVADDTVPVEPG